MPKMHLNTFGSRAPPGPAGELKVLPKLPSGNRGVVLVGEEREGKKRRERIGR